MVTRIMMKSFLVLSIVLLTIQFRPDYCCCYCDYVNGFSIPKYVTRAVTRTMIIHRSRSRRHKQHPEPLPSSPHQPRSLFGGGGSSKNGALSFVKCATATLPSSSSSPYSLVLSSSTGSIAGTINAGNVTTATAAAKAAAVAVVVGVFMVGIVLAHLTLSVFEFDHILRKSKIASSLDGMIRSYHVRKLERICKTKVPPYLWNEYQSFVQSIDVDDRLEIVTELYLKLHGVTGSEVTEVWEYVEQKKDKLSALILKAYVVVKEAKERKERKKIEDYFRTVRSRIGDNKKELDDARILLTDDGDDERLLTIWAASSLESSRTGESDDDNNDDYVFDKDDLYTIFRDFKARKGRDVEGTLSVLLRNMKYINNRLGKLGFEVFLFTRKGKEDVKRIVKRTRDVVHTISQYKGRNDYEALMRDLKEHEEKYERFKMKYTNNGLGKQGKLASAFDSVTREKKEQLYRPVKKLREQLQTDFIENKGMNQFKALMRELQEYEEKYERIIEINDGYVYTEDDLSTILRDLMRINKDYAMYGTDRFSKEFRANAQNCYKDFNVHDLKEVIKKQSNGEKIYEAIIREIQKFEEILKLSIFRTDLEARIGQGDDNKDYDDGGGTVWG